MIIPPADSVVNNSRYFPSAQTTNKQICHTMGFTCLATMTLSYCLYILQWLLLRIC